MENIDKIKLLLIADTYYPKVDGTLKFMGEFLKRAENDFEISLLVPDFGNKKEFLEIKAPKIVTEYKVNVEIK